MIAGFYSSAAGMLGQIEQQDVISNNLANANSAGFKRQRVGFSAFDVDLQKAKQGIPSFDSGHARCVVPIAFARQDARQGELQATGNRTNLAIDGEGYFAVQTRNGKILTRDGNFETDSTGKLCTSDGDLALGQNGPITLTGKKWEVEGDGTVKADGVAVDKLRIELPKDAPAGSKIGRVVQGQLESSNVSAIQETTGMITALRAYEANQKAIQAIDQTLDKIINQAGRA